MAKSKHKKTSADGSGGVSKKAGQFRPSKTYLPAFDESALSKLTQKIEAQLEKPKEKKGVKGRTKHTKYLDSPRNGDPLPQTTSVGNELSKKKGKKRGRDGEVLIAEKRGQSNNSSKTVKPRNNGHLEKDVLSLGGTHEDIEFLDGIESESEMDQGSQSRLGGNGCVDDKSFQKDINNLLKDIAPQRDMSETNSITGGVDTDETESVSDKEAQNAVMPPKQAFKSNRGHSEPLVPKAFQKRKSNLVVTPQSDWFAVELPELPELPKKVKHLPKPLLEKIHTHAMALLQAENEAYAVTPLKSSSSHKFYNTIMTSGTLIDKISALTLSVQESPLHNMRALENLLSLARKRSRAQAVDVLRALKDLFGQGSLLPRDRKLKHFHHQSGLVAAFQDSGTNWTAGNRLPRNLDNQYLILWAFEHWLKDLYFEILKILEVWCNDEIEFARSRAVSFVWELLKEKPEQESNLLRLLINKLGDPSKKIASRASYLVLQLEVAHPMMKATIIKAVESEFLFKPGQSQHAKYYGVITLNQTALAKNEAEVANKLLDIYFSLFVAVLKPKERENHKGHSRSRPGKRGQRKHTEAHALDHDAALRDKMISAILTGVNRAYPYSSASSERLSKHIDSLFRVTHSSNFNTSVQALMLIQQISTTHQVSTDRYYRTLYESLLDPRLVTTSKQSLYLNLMYRSLKQDVNIKRVKAFIKRLVQILNLHQPSFICGVFHLIKELEQTFPSVKGLIDEPEDADDDEEIFRDVPEENDGHPQVSENQSTPVRALRYDCRKRDPEYSNADRSCLWEIVPFFLHFHPSVSVSSAHLLNHEPLEGKPDLSLHTLIHFLDRFVYRNPKSATSALRGNSVMQPLVGSERGDLLVTARPTSKMQVPVNDESFWTKQAGEVAVEDAFFHDYFRQIGKNKKSVKAKKEKKKKRKYDESETDEVEESEIWHALVRSKGEVDPDEYSDDDMDMDDMDSANEADVDGDAIRGEADVADFSEDVDGDMAVSDGEEIEDIHANSEDPWADSDEMSATEESVKEQAVAESSKDSRSKRRKLKQLPTFASAEDYAAMVDDDDDEDLG